MTWEVDGPLGAGDRTVPHYVDRERLDATYYCGECGDEVDGDGDSFWHKDANLNPHDDEVPA